MPSPGERVNKKSKIQLLKNTNYHFVKCTFSEEKLPVFGSLNDRRGDKEKAQVVGVMTYGMCGIEGAGE